jgi:hypothetical protein
LHVFRGSEELALGDEITFAIPAFRNLRDAAMGPAGGERWHGFEGLMAARVAELFLNGTPPALELADYGEFCSLMDSATDRPITPWPTKEHVVAAWAEFWGISNDRAEARLARELDRMRRRLLPPC